MNVDDVGWVDAHSALISSSVSPAMAASLALADCLAASLASCSACMVAWLAASCSRCWISSAVSSRIVSFGCPSASQFWQQQISMAGAYWVISFLLML